MVGHAALDRRIGVRVPASQPIDSPVEEGRTPFAPTSLASSREGFARRGGSSSPLPLRHPQPFD